MEHRAEVLREKGPSRSWFMRGQVDKYTPFAQSRGVPQTHLPWTEELSARLLRLPMYFDLTERAVEEAASIVLDFYQTRHARRCRAHDI
jgi:dTDP-4-amino-4,6-dideoxygalactose transaminase